VIVVGGGFGGLQAATHLASAPVELTLVDRRNFHLFQPLTYQVATGALSPGEICYPAHDGVVDGVRPQARDRGGDDEALRAQDEPEDPRLAVVADGEGVAAHLVAGGAAGQQVLERGDGGEHALAGGTSATTTGATQRPR
jgi:flavin-dependent dehydrogenase